MRYGAPGTTTEVAILEPLRYLELVADITVKNLDDDVLARLARRAESEGVSMQELARRAIARAAAIPELEDQLRARRAGRQPMTWDEFLARRGGA
jgi:plasmid stability protein